MNRVVIFAFILFLSSCKVTYVTTEKMKFIVYENSSPISKEGYKSDQIKTCLKRVNSKKITLIDNKKDDLKIEYKVSGDYGELILKKGDSKCKFEISKSNPTIDLTGDDIINIAFKQKGAAITLTQGEDYYIDIVQEEDSKNTIIEIKKNLDKCLQN